MATDNRHVMAWAVLYPESCNPEFRKILQEMHVMFAVSPLHDMDISANGKPKKPHYHVLIDFSDVKQKKSRKQFEEIFDQIGAVCSPLDHEFFCGNRRLTYRYLLHLDDADKHLYSFDDLYVYGFNGDVYDFIFSAANVNECLNNMISFIVENKLTFYCDFALYCSHEVPEWNLTLLKHTRYITEFIKSYDYLLRSTGTQGNRIYIDID